MRWVEKYIKYYDSVQSCYVADTDEEFEHFIKNAQKLGYNLKAVDYSSSIGLTYFGSRKIKNTSLTIEDIHNIVEKECNMLGVNSVGIGIADDGVILSIYTNVVDFYSFKTWLFKEYNVQYEKKRC